MAGSAANATAPGELAWRVIGLVNLYRLMVPLVLLGLRWSAATDFDAGGQSSTLFLSVCIAYFSVSLLLVVARRLSWPSLPAMALVNIVLDSVAISLILYASGGVSSNLGILLVLPVGAMAVLGGNRNAFLIASIAALGVLVQQFMVTANGDAPASDFSLAGVLGAVLFVVALPGWLAATRLRESEALVRRREIDLANLAQLSQYIVQHLRESILVLDSEDRIRLINETAAQILGDPPPAPGALLGECCPRLLYLLESWRQNSGAPHDSAHTLIAADGARVIRPHFAPLGSAQPAPVLVFLEDTSVIAEKVQQSKLAALGRLSASIAHEIRNPVGAMSHAAQLLGESPQAAPEDRRLTEIIQSNAERVSGIIDNVLQLSRREERQIEKLSLREWAEEFRDEFCETMQLSPDRVAILGPRDDIEVRADPSQLHQVIWNLCDNALRHGLKGRDGEAIAIRFGRLAAGARPYLEVADRGAGVPAEHVERIFEPFFSSERGGTGLGLFLARELAQTNGATLLYDSHPGGGSIFRLVFTDPRRWEVD